MTKPSEYDSGIRVERIAGTEYPERLVCQCARGDYYDGYVGDTSYEELMDPVEHDDRHEEIVGEIRPEMYFDTEDEYITEAKTYKLLEKLFGQGHWGAFEHPQITLAVEGVSRSCMAQVTRHRPITFDVQSQRYVDFSEKNDPVKLPKSLADEDHFSRETGEVGLSEYEQEKYRYLYRERINEALDAYESMVEAGVPKEDARFVLPIGTTVNWTMSMNARTLLHLANVRGKANAQWEAQELTANVLEQFDSWMPYTSHLWEKRGSMALAP